jgi:hypothetical protein
VKETAVTVRAACCKEVNSWIGVAHCVENALILYEIFLCLTLKKIGSADVFSHHGRHLFFHCICVFEMCFLGTVLMSFKHIL